MFSKNSESELFEKYHLWDVSSVNSVEAGPKVSSVSAL